MMGGSASDQQSNSETRQSVAEDERHITVDLADHERCLIHGIARGIDTAQVAVRLWEA